MQPRTILVCKEWLCLVSIHIHFHLKSIRLLIPQLSEVYCWEYEKDGLYEQMVFSRKHSYILNADKCTVG